LVVACQVPAYFLNLFLLIHSSASGGDESKGATEELTTEGLEDGNKSTTHKVSECLPLLYALFKKTPSALLPLQTSG
jgi:hypothetical protein